MGDAIAERFYKAIDFLRGRKLDYQQTFGAPCGQRVLDDLARFCRANESTFDQDPRVHAALEGRREVFLRIVHHLNFTSQQLYEIYNTGKLPGGATK